MKTKLKDTALTSYRNYNENVLHYLKKDEFVVLKNRINNRNFIFQKSDTGNEDFVIDSIDRSIYNKRMDSMLSNIANFINSSNFSIN